PENDKKNLIAVVADGMGGHNAGEVASKMACQLVINYCIKNWTQQAPNTLLYKALLEANQGIAAAGNSNPEQQGMGTTASSVIIQQNVCFIGHIGDSRVYLLRNGELRQLSIDHTLVNKMFENGEISETERDNHPMKNVLLEALGTMPNIQPPIATEGLAMLEGDRLLLCSDGVYDAVSEEDIKDLLIMKRPEFVLECLSSVVTSRNVSDNFSVVLIEISTVHQSIPSMTKEQNIVP